MICAGRKIGASMKRECLTFIWSLARRIELPVRIHYHVETLGRCRVFELRKVEELD
jgi:hypothetical protein